MPNIFDYINWRDIDLRKVEFNEIDNLILSRLAYFPFDGLIKENEEITVSESYERYKTSKTTGRILQKEDLELFPNLAKSTRFGNMKITQYINKIDAIEEKQFSAITILMPDNTIYIAYRGTDNTIVGWKEDLNMSFSDLVASQIDAVNYLETIANKYSNKIRVGGHSKGGNLAVYAAAFCKKNIQNKIIEVYNNDGPGFNKAIIEKEGYQNILNKVNTYIPQTSIIGRLLNHEEKIHILKSTQTGIMQHDLYSWQVMGDKFIRSELTNSSEFIDKTITDLLETVEPEKKKMFINSLFEILEATQVQTLSEIKSKKFESAISMVEAYKALDPESREIMSKIVKELLTVGKSNIKVPEPKKYIRINKLS